MSIEDCTIMELKPFSQYNLQDFNVILLCIQDEYLSREATSLLFLDKSVYRHEAAKLYQNI